MSHERHAVAKAAAGRRAAVAAAEELLRHRRFASESELEPTVVTTSGDRNAGAVDLAIQFPIASGAIPAYAVEQMNLARS